MTKSELGKKIMETLDASVDEWATRDNRGRLHVWLEKIANVLIDAGLRFDEDDKQEGGNRNNELFNVAMFCAKHAAPPKVRDGGEAVQREYAETLEKENEQLKAENAALKEKLEKAVELPSGNRVWFITEDEEGEESYVISKPTNCLTVDELYEIGKKYFTTYKAAEKAAKELK